jgi:hypothetical protein
MTAQVPLLPRCLSECNFGSFLSYSPQGRGSSAESKKSRTITHNIKNVKQGYIKYVVDRLVEEMERGRKSTILSDFLGEDVLLVPCPKSSPLVPGGLWPPKEICDELVRHGLGARSAALLERIRPVTRSHTAPGNKRPKPPEHIQSMAVVDRQLVPSRITVVDDVITRGATLIAAISHLKHNFPSAQVQAFAVVRTKSFEPEVGQILDPVVGKITFDGMDAQRRP